MNSKLQEVTTGLLPVEDIQVLAAMRHGLLTSVAPETTSVMGKTICNFTVEFLDRLIVKHSEWPAILRRQIRRRAEVLRKAAELLIGIKAIDAALHASATATARGAAALEQASLGELEQAQRDVDTALEKLFPVLMSAKTRARPGYDLNLANELLREMIASVRDTERDFNAASKQRVNAYSTKANSAITITAETLLAYLRARFPERKNLEVVSFYELPGGSSKSTILLDVRGLDSDTVSSLVFRLDREAGSTDTRVINEVSTLQAAFQNGLLAPEFLWAEPDASKIGLAFIVVRKVDATLGGNMWTADPQLCDAGTGRDLARILAKLHTLDTAKLQLRGALNLDPAENPVKALIGNIRQLWKAKKREPDAILESCLCWLEENMPPAPKRLSLIHGDVSFHNIMVKDKKVAALLDWELSHLGDPNEDLSYARPVIEQMLPWEDFLAEYRKHGGGEYSEELGQYYGAWRGARNAVYTLTCGHSFHTDANLDLRWGYFAANYRVLQLETAENVARAGLKAV